MKNGFLPYAALLIWGLSTSRAQEAFFHPELTWHTIETPRFFVHYHTGTDRTAKVVAKVAEEIYDPITSLYGHRPDQKVSFVIKDYDDYSNGAAYFYDNVVEIWATSMDFDLRGTHNWLRNVVTHEFTHIVQIQSAMKFGRRVPAVYFQWLGYEAERRPDVLYGYPNVVVSYLLSGFVVPSWFAEGVAQYNRAELAYDGWDSHRDMILRMYALDGNMLTWNEMAVFGKTSLGNESAYNAGFSFVQYLASRYGEDKLAEISRSLSSLTEPTIDGAIKRAISKDGKAVYDEWVQFVREDYARRSSGVKNNLVSGDVVADVGFGNFYPTFSPDGGSLAYVSNKEADYFSPSSVYLLDITTKSEKKLVSGVRSNLSWSPDGKNIYYARTTRHNDHWSNYHDLYVYNIGRDEETRLTRGLRANTPAVSPDGKSIAYVAGNDGTLNLFIMRVDGMNHRRLTHFRNGEQVYNPKWSPDGAQIVFDYSIKDGRDIALVSAQGGDVNFLVRSEDDSRNPLFDPTGDRILFVSDRTGIFNVHEYDLQNGRIQQITNVLGGAFMPTVNGDGRLACALYSSSGYKIALMQQYRPLRLDSTQGDIQYVRADNLASSMQASLNASRSGASGFNWSRLRFYDDSELPDQSTRDYTNVFTNLSFFPLVRVDNYNPKNKGIDVVKLGLYAFSRDVLDKYSLFIGAALNRKLERDLFFIFDFRESVPGLFNLGLEPAISFELYNITRNRETEFSRVVDTLGINITYSLLEFDLVYRQKVLMEALDLELRFAHSRYTASIELPPLPGVPQIIRFDDLYFVGNDLSVTWTFTETVPSRTQEINPVGRKVRLRYDYEFSKLGTGETEIKDGLALPVYDRFRFHRLEAGWREHLKLPGWKHTLTAHVRGGSILGPSVDDFFDFYMGGLTGMKGYPFFSLGGNELASFNLTYRFPILENIDLRFLHLTFDKLYAAIYADIGDAWTGDPKGNKFKRDAGVEVRLESFSWYAFPTRMFFNASYGFDRFDKLITFDNSTVTYGQEWRFYFGVLFGFDLD